MLVFPLTPGALLSLPSAATRAALCALILAAGCAGDKDVYVAGAEAGPSVWEARLWRNGWPLALEEAARGSKATGLALSGGDLYVSGGVSGLKRDRAAYWKNGALVPLTEGTGTWAFAEGIAVQGQDVHVVGYETVNGIDVAMHWKNGVPTALTDGTHSANALAVAVAGDDVYVTGYEIRATWASPTLVVITNVALLWKNGVATALSSGLEPAWGSALATWGEDVYVAGREGYGSVYRATLWKNGVPTALSDGVFGSWASGLCVDGRTVVVAGGQGDGIVEVARLWKSGLPVDLTSASADGRVSSGEASAVACAGGEQYAAGTHAGVAGYWDAGNWVALTEGGHLAEARAIAVAGR